ncbi:TetR/AcrR family transcriptional regulator [Gordonia polyisoprenivorans]|uniref:TetR/AcrR family transcriptional regulator n=2 Tax=Gordonia polyisoprenivorans TaxID=84595 RepID=UPI001AD626DE|nr:TetR family transcriptional regulator C-terminal domain-containing protein [Gordonia polyisoprenivorans]
MPRTPDHTARRAEIAKALVRVAGRDGLHAVTMRSVAAEAGVSLRLIQYYFNTKEELMVGALRYLERSSHDRWAQRLAEYDDPPPTRAVIETFLLEALPTDEASRAFHRVGMSYAVLAMTDTKISDEPFVSGINRLESILAEALKRAVDDGQLPAHVAPELEATRLVTMVNGLGTSILVDQRTPEQAAEVIQYHLDQLFARPLLEVASLVPTRP